MLSSWSKSLRWRPSCEACYRECWGKYLLEFEARWRKRKVSPERRQDGHWSRNVQRMGPLTMEARAYGLERVLDIQQRVGIMSLVDANEEAVIREMWARDLWPRKWSADDAAADAPLDVAFQVTADGRLASQAVQCGYEKVASCMWEPRCEQCGNQGSFTWLDLPEG